MLKSNKEHFIPPTGKVVDAAQKTRIQSEEQRQHAARDYTQPHYCAIVPQNKDLSSSLYHLGDRLRISDPESRANA